MSGRTRNSILTTHNLSFAYSRHQPLVLDTVTVAFPPASITAITGTSGSGKSTLLYLLALMLKVTDGAVLWKSHDVSALSDGQRARLRASHMGFIFQDAMLDPSRSVLENVCEPGIFAGLPRVTQLERANRLLTRFGVDHRIDHRPGEISGGQAQRVALCRALLTQPQVIFGDEPTGNLDSESAAIVWRSLLDYAHEGATVIVATHDRALAAEADHRLDLDQKES